MLLLPFAIFEVAWLLWIAHTASNSDHKKLSSCVDDLTCKNCDRYNSLWRQYERFATWFINTWIVAVLQMKHSRAFNMNLKTMIYTIRMVFSRITWLNYDGWTRLYCFLWGDRPKDTAYRECLIRLYCACPCMCVAIVTHNKQSLTACSIVGLYLNDEVRTALLVRVKIIIPGPFSFSTIVMAFGGCQLPQLGSYTSRYKDAAARSRCVLTFIEMEVRCSWHSGVQRSRGNTLLGCAVIRFARMRVRPSYSMLSL